MGLWCSDAMAAVRAAASVVGAQAKKSIARVIKRSISKLNAGFGVFWVAVLAIAMNSMPARRLVFSRKHSRNNRLTRFRSCERLICFFASAKPSLGRDEGRFGKAFISASLGVFGSRRAATRVMQDPEKRLPAANIRLYSAGKSSRAWRGKSMHDLLVGIAIRLTRTSFCLICLLSVKQRSIFIIELRQTN